MRGVNLVKHHLVLKTRVHIQVDFHGKVGVSLVRTDQVVVEDYISLVAYL